MDRIRHHAQCLILAGMVTAVSHSAADAQTSVWGLARHDHFTIETVVERETELQVDESPPTTAHTTDTLQIKYSVDNVLAGGDIAIRAEVIQASRVTPDEAGSGGSGASRQLGLLQNLSVVLVVDPDGIIKGIPGFREGLAQLTDVEQTSGPVINESVSQAVFASWVGQPFWTTIHGDTPEAGAKWERVTEVSLGQMGAIKTIATCEIEDVGEEAANIRITGNSRHVPPAASQPNNTAALAFTDVRVTIDSFSGTATMALPKDIPDEPEAAPDDPLGLRVPRERPPFESLSLSLSCSGDATVTAGDTQRKLHFEQQQTQVSRLLPGYRIGRQPELRIFSTPPR